MKKAIKKNWRGQIVIRDEKTYHKLILKAHTAGHLCSARRYEDMLERKRNARKVAKVQG